MNFKFINYFLLTLSFLFLSEKIVAQDKELENNPFEVFKEYKQWGLTLSPRVYAKARTKVINGIYDIETNNSIGLSLGFDYAIFPTKQWSFRAGARVSFLSPENFNISLPAEELAPWRDQPFDEDLKDLAIYLSVPLEAEWKYPLAKNKFLSLRSGVEIMFYTDYQASVGLLVDPYNDDSNEMFFILNKTSKHTIHPFFKFSPGVYFILNPFILQTSLVYQKNLRTIHEGTFSFSNLAITNSGTGTYDFSGDFIGLELTLFLKKKNK